MPGPEATTSPQTSAPTFTQVEFDDLRRRVEQLQNRAASAVNPADLDAQRRQIERLERQLHDLAHAVVQDGNMHAAGEDRVHELFADGFEKHFGWVRPERPVNDPTQLESPEQSKESEMAKLLKELGLNSPDKLRALAALIKSEPAKLEQKAA